MLRVERDNAYSNLVLNEALKNASLEKTEAAFVSTLFYGVLERKVTLDYYISALSSKPIRKISPLTLQVLRCALYQLLYMDKIPPSAAVNEAVKIVKHSKESYAAGFVNALLRSTLRELPPLPDTRDFYGLSVKHSCSESLAEMLISDYGFDTAENILACALDNTPVYVRVNTLKTTTGELAQRFTDAGICCEYAPIPSALAIKGAGSIENNELYKNGFFHVQDLSSQICAETLKACAGDSVLDICAAPGGKTFTLSQMMCDKGKIVACDLHKHRVELIEKGAKRLGIGCIETRVSDAAVKNSEFLDAFDRVLCDVPCSGSGIIGRKPDIKYKDFSDNSQLHAVQLSILSNGFEYLKAGGTLVYSTCSILSAENKAVVEKLLNNQKYAELVSEHTFLPHIDGTDGFYTAVIKKTR